MKKVFVIPFVSLILLAAVSCGNTTRKPVEPALPQGEVTREFLSQIRVGKEGNFQYWNQDSPALCQLKAFVATVTDPDGQGYVPPQDRIAAFDVDGTLMCETAPYYFNWMLFLHRYLHDSSFTPPEEDRLWAEEVEQYVLANRKSKPEWGLKQQELQAIGFRGMTDGQFSEYVKDFIDSEYVIGLSGLKWGTALYWPMIEAVSYLVANDFVVFLSSGVDRDVCRAVSDGIYEIPTYHMMASDVNYVLENQPEWVEMTNSESYEYTPGEAVGRGDFLQLNTAVNKIVKIRRELGQKPILCWGNSKGDYPMFHYASTDNRYPHISFCLLCDDTERELGNPDKAARCKADCEQNGWIPVSMRDEWWTIYGPQVKRIDAR
ncbi:MAG: haloacid dehalogenase-like hydrolase [Bacteroidales bacterium]|nr:haloacid dehalogenase-like hydrolase [Bacteroidales bacterium]